MADQDAAPAPADSRGVVKPLRIPGAEALAGLWATLPPVGRAFLVLALVDIALRILGIGGLPSPVDLAQPLSILGFLPHLAVVLLPVVVLWRRPDAAAATPLVLWGAVALALVELLTLPLVSLFPAAGGNLAPWTLVQVLAIAGRAGGYLALAVGLAALTRSVPSQNLLGFANLVMWVIGGAAVTSLLLTFLLPAADVGDPAWTSQIQVVNALGQLPLLAFAYLARAIIRGTVDLRRPIVATSTATGAVVVAAVLHVVTLALNVMVMLQLAFALSSGPLGASPGYGFTLLGIVVDVLLVFAFALGLADASGRIARPGSRQPLEAVDGVEPVRWPAPGGEVPAYRAIERPALPPQPATTAKKGRRKSKESQA